MGYTKDTIKGISWVGLFRLSTRIIAFLKTALLARILSPAQFGVYGIALLAVAFLETITETGVNIILVQEQNIDENINSAWLVSIVRGIIISFFLILTAPFIARFFNAPDSTLLLYLISTVPLLRGFINPSVVKLQKELKFNIEFRYKLSVFLLDAVVAILASFVMRSPIGIIYGLIAGVLLEIILSYIIVRPLPRILFNKQYINNLFHKGKWVTASGIFNYLFQNVDRIVVGRMLGTTPLGFYQMAYTLSTMPITEISDVFSRVTFPVFTKIADDRARLKTAFIKTILTIGVITLPFSFILFFIPDKIVMIALGEKWISIVPLLKILAFFGMIRAISGSTSALFLAIGKQKYVTIVTLIGIIGMALPLVPLVALYGTVGVALSAFIGVLVSLPFIYYFTNKVFKTAVS